MKPQFVVNPELAELMAVIGQAMEMHIAIMNKHFSDNEDFEKQSAALNSSLDEAFLCASMMVGHNITYQSKLNNQ